MKKTFWLYWDPESHHIQSISPVENKDAAEFPFMMIDRETAIPFLSGEASMTEWMVGGTLNKPFLTQNMLDLPSANPGELQAIPRLGNNSGFIGVSVTVFLASDTIVVAIPKSHVGEKLRSITEKNLRFVLTKRNEPEHVLKEFTVPTKDLIANGSVKVSLDLPQKYSDFSVMTYGVFNSYRYEVIRSIWQKQNDESGVKANNLVAFRSVDVVPRYEKGVVAHHDTTTNKLIVSIMNGAELMSYAESDGILFLIKPRDATIILHHVTLDLAALSNEQVVEFALPWDIGRDWGMGGTPIAENVYFTRK